MAGAYRESTLKLRWSTDAVSCVQRIHIRPVDNAGGNCSGWSQVRLSRMICASFVCNKVNRWVVKMVPLFGAWSSCQSTIHYSQGFMQDQIIASQTCFGVNCQASLQTLKCV